jgi:hypothetical protein
MGLKKNFPGWGLKKNGENTPSPRFDRLGGLFFAAKKTRGGLALLWANIIEIRREIQAE